MYNYLLSTNWDDICESEYTFKRNTVKRVVQIFGKEFDENDDSLILVYYNMHTGTPMILLQRYNRKLGKNNIPSIDGYNMTFEEGNEDGEDYTEITYVPKSLQEALQE